MNPTCNKLKTVFIFSLTVIVYCVQRQTSPPIIVTAGTISNNQLTHNSCDQDSLNSCTM